MNCLRRFWMEESGAILSAEMVLLGSTLVAGGVVGLNALRDNVVQELDDVSKALGSIDQSYGYSGVYGHGAYTAGSSFRDRAEFQDTAGVQVGATSDTVQVCSQVVGPGPIAYGPSVTVLPEAEAVETKVVKEEAKVVKKEEAVEARPARKPKRSKKPAAAEVEVEVEKTEVQVEAAPAAACQPTLILGARGLVPLAQCMPAQQPVRVFLDPCRPGPAFIDAPEGAFNGPCLPPMQVLVGCPTGFVDTGCCYGPAPGAICPTVPVTRVVPQLVPAPTARVAGGRIDLGFTSVGDDELKQIRTAKNVRCLHILGSKVTNAGLVHLKDLDELEMLFLLGTQVTDEGLVHLTKLDSLTSLHLIGASITDAGIESLLAIKKLAVVDLRGTRVTAVGVAKLHAALPQCRILY